MKKIFSGALLFFILILNSESVRAQSCMELKSQRDESEKKLGRIGGLKLTYEDFFSIMDDPKADVNIIPEEIATCEHRISWLEQKIADGDNSPEIAAELKANRSRMELLKLRMSPNFNKTTIMKDPRYKEQQRNSNNLSTDELDLKMAISKIDQQLKEKNCPTDGKDTGGIDDLFEKKKTTGSFDATWTYSDPKDTDGMVMTLKLNGSGSSVTGFMSFGPPDMPAKYSINGCVENGDNKLRCGYTAVLEDYEKYVDSKGSVEMFVSGNSLLTKWNDFAAPTVRWKPGHESPLKRVSEARKIEITFTK